MKLHTIHIGVLVPIAAALLLALPAAAAEFTSVSGSVEIGRGQPPSWSPARVGDVLAPGDTVRTGSSGRAELSAAEGTVRLFEGSILRIPRATGPGVELDQGSSVFEVPRRSPHDPYRVRTPQAVVMVKGTRFSVNVDDAAVSVGVVRGLVAVQAPGDAADAGVLVRPGFQVVGGAGQSFELGLLEQGADPWEAWGAGAAAPPAPASAAAEQRMADVHAARAAVRSSVDRVLAAGESSTAPVIAAAAGERSKPRVDAIIDTELESEVAGAYQAARVMGGVGSSTGGIDIEFVEGELVMISGAGVATMLDDDDLESVIGGNTSLFGDPLLALLSAQNIDPTTFAAELLDILDEN